MSTSTSTITTGNVSWILFIIMSNLKLNRLIAHKVFPERKSQLGQAWFASTIWQQDNDKPHQANMVMIYLDRAFKERMLVLKAKRGDCW